MPDDFLRRERAVESLTARSYSHPMSFAQVLEELPVLSVEQRQLLIRRAIELDEPDFSAEDEALVEARLAAHHADPGSSVPLDTMKARQDRPLPGRD